jgi:nucleolar GTP-binding protein
LKKWYDIPEDERHNIIPEMWEGRNVADFVDPDIEKVSANDYF